MDKRVRVGIFNDKGMGKWLAQSFEPIADRADITLFIPENNKHDPSSFRLPQHVLTHSHEVRLALKRPFFYLQRYSESEKLSRTDFYPLSLEEHFLTHKYDIVLTKADRSLYTLARLKERFGFKIIYRYPFTLPFTHIFEKRSEFARRQSFDKVDHFICISETARKNLELEGIEPSKIDVVHNSVDLTFFKPGNKDDGLMSRLGISREEKVILFVGKLVSWKNPFSILYAAKVLVQKGMRIKLLFAGKGAQKANLLRTAELCGLSDKCIFLDFVENTELNKYYALADAFVMPSLTTITWEDQFPFAVVEAMASRLPVIVTNSGGMPELVGDAGRIFPQGNYRELAQHLEEILCDESLRGLMSVKARQRAEDMFDNSKNSLKILDIFLKVASQAGNSTDRFVT